MLFPSILVITFLHAQNVFKVQSESCFKNKSKK